MTSRHSYKKSCLRLKTPGGVFIIIINAICWIIEEIVLHHLFPLNTSTYRLAGHLLARGINSWLLVKPPDGVFVRNMNTIYRVIKENVLFSFCHLSPFFIASKSITETLVGSNRNWLPFE